MSHYTRVSTTLCDAELIAAALRATGFPDVELHDTPQPLRGFAGGGRYAAEIVVRRGHAGKGRSALADFGFVRRPNGSFEAIVDDWDRRALGSDWMSRLTQAYGYAAALRYAELHGYEVDIDEMEADGTRRLTMRRTRYS